MAILAFVMAYGCAKISELVLAGSHDWLILNGFAGVLVVLGFKTWCDDCR